MYIPCAKEKDQLTIRIFNDSRFETSNFRMETTGCQGNFAALEQGETTCPISVGPFKAKFDYMIVIVRMNIWDNEFTREDTEAADGQLITEGDCQISCKVDG